jgi:hypothetical protein
VDFDLPETIDIQYDQFLSKPEVTSLKRVENGFADALKARAIFGNYCWSAQYDEEFRTILVLRRITTG